MQCQYVFT
uniref:Uncharacterized protein n=1 Tax=Panagrolaimus sp. PS1159 TaxID=55785 RepID=A0AC35ESQ8_9BILA